MLRTLIGSLNWRCCFLDTENPMKAQPSWQILEFCLKKTMLVIAVSASPVLLMLNPPANLKASWFFLTHHAFAVLCSDLVWQTTAAYPSPPPLHYIWVSSFIIAVQVLYAGFTQKRLFSVRWNCLCIFYKCMSIEETLYIGGYVK